MNSDQDNVRKQAECFNYNNLKFCMPKNSPLGLSFAFVAIFGLFFSRGIKPRPTLTESTCPELTRRINSIIYPNRNKWSISALNSDGEYIINLNGKVPRVPASNQKLITTAYALDKLGTGYQFQTYAYINRRGIVELVGNGDPDLSQIDIRKIAKRIASEIKTNKSISNPPKVLLREATFSNWWPSSWSLDDRTEYYGAPITKLAISSNSLPNGKSNVNPINTFRRSLSNELFLHGQVVEVQIKESPIRINRYKPRKRIYERNSAPMLSILSLANTTSHNFTAEVLLRNASGYWDTEKSSKKTLEWVKSLNIPIHGLRISDGSGLSRANRTTTQTLSALLFRMSNHPLYPYYEASMAIAGRRGTMRSFYLSTPLEGRFRGKTGTLEGIRAVSGILNSNTGKIFVSVISYDNERTYAKTADILINIQRYSSCPSKLF